MSVFRVILVRIFPTFSRIRTEYVEIRSISPYSVQMRGNVGKMQTRITPDTHTFYVVMVNSFVVSLDILVMTNILHKMIKILHEKC